MKKSLFALLLFFFASSTALAAQPESGWWYNPDESGRGFNIEFQGEQVFIASFIYDAEGRQIWYSGGGELTENAWSGELQRFEGGQCLQCEYTPPNLAESSPFEIAFTSATTAVIEWQNVRIDIQRFRFGFNNNIDDYLGEWIFVSDDSANGNDSGDHVFFDDTDQLADGTRIAQGVRIFDPNRIAVAFIQNDELVVAVQNDDDTEDFYIFPAAGSFNSRSGLYWLRRVGSDPEGDGRAAVAARIQQIGSAGDGFGSTRQRSTVSQIDERLALIERAKAARAAVTQ